jgi:hypothetical protein
MEARQIFLRKSAARHNGRTKEAQEQEEQEERRRQKMEHQVNKARTRSEGWRFGGGGDGRLVAGDEIMINLIWSSCVAAVELDRTKAGA